MMFDVVLFYGETVMLLYGYCSFHTMIPYFDFHAAVQYIYTIICCKMSKTLHW